MAKLNSESVGLSIVLLGGLIVLYLAGGTMRGCSNYIDRKLGGAQVDTYKYWAW